jgi:hypothetical protein
MIKPMPFPFNFKYDLKVFEELLNIAESPKFKRVLLNNNKNGWRSKFKDGIGGLCSRMWGSYFNYHVIHAWDDYFPKGLFKTESYIASTLFNMDSALECCVFALNALGYAIDESAFVDINDSGELARINPLNVIGNDRQRIPGYQEYFTLFSDLWNKNKPLIDIIRENHDVTKHRQFNFIGGGQRRDPPQSYLLKHKVDNVNKLRNQEVFPWNEVLLSNNPKGFKDRPPIKKPSELIYLEKVAQSLSNLLTESGEKVKKDIVNLMRNHE